MKVMTMNTHSLVESDFETKREWFAEMILKEKPDILAMQEVNQTAAGDELPLEELLGYVSCAGSDPVAVRSDNYAAWLAARLRKEGLEYEWTWIPAKLGYGKYDEGMALFSIRPIEKSESFFTSKSRDYNNWKTRKILGIQVENTWYYTVHMGWWDDEEEPFISQWSRLEEHLHHKKQNAEPVWLLGDFNSSAKVRNQGYDLVRMSDWRDTYTDAMNKDSGITVGTVIDGWRERASELTSEKTPGMRLDYIFTTRPVNVDSSRVICNGVNYPVVSDHYGVMVEIRP